MMIMMFSRAESGDSMFLQNVGIYLQVYTASQHRRTTLSSPLPWEPQISQQENSSVACTIIPGLFNGSNSGMSYEQLSS
jgi:hypothetical protein